MEIIGKVLVAGIGAILLVMAGVAITMGNTDEVAANQYLDAAAKVILESHYNEDVIEECVVNAADNGYTLSVFVYSSNSPGKKPYAEMRLVYKYSLKLFQYEKEKTISKIL